MIDFYDYQAKILVLDNLIKPEQTALRARLDWCNEKLAGIQTYLVGIDRDLACRCLQVTQDTIDWGDCPIRSHRAQYRDFTNLDPHHWQHDELLADIIYTYGVWTVHLLSGGRLIGKSFSTVWDAIDAWHKLDATS